MQKKWKRDKAIEETHHAPAVAPSPHNSHIDEDSDMELKHKVHRKNHIQKLRSHTRKIV